MNDEFSGQGGAYLLDTETGKRTLVERTAEPVRTTNTEPAAEAEQTEPNSQE